MAISAWLAEGFGSLDLAPKSQCVTPSKDHMRLLEARAKMLKSWEERTEKLTKGPSLAKQKQLQDAVAARIVQLLLGDLAHQERKQAKAPPDRTAKDLLLVGASGSCLH